MNNNLKLIHKIHAGADGSCYSAILKAWEIDDHPYSKNNLNIKTSIMDLHRGQRQLDINEIAEEFKIKPKTVKKHIDQYDRLMDRYWNPDKIDKSMYDRLYPTNTFLKKCEDLSNVGSEDTYFSLNSFWRRNKAGVDIRHINAFILDFDFYKLNQYMHLSPQKFYKSKIKSRLPIPPTGVVDSGRGLYVIYAFDHCSYHMERLYKAVQKWFYLKFKGYGMDQLALNLTQVIRIPGTLNTHCLKEVTVLEFNDTSYRLSDFAKLLPYTLEQVIEHRKDQVKTFSLAKQKDGTNKYKINLENIQKRKPYFKDFLDDVEKLIVMRNRKKQYSGYRETLLYLVRERATWSGFTINESVQIALKCNSMFHEPLSNRVVEDQCKPSRGRQKTSLETIIDKLGIDISEQQELKVLRRKWLKKSMYSKRKQKHPLLNLTEKQFKCLKRRTAVCELKNEKHLRNSDIAKLLNVDKSTVTRDLRYIKEHPAEFQIDLKKYMDELEGCRCKRKFTKSTTYDEQKQLLEWLKIGYTALDYIVRQIGVAKN